MFNNPFSQQSTVKVPTDCDVVFVADFFVEDLIGGAELTTEALIKSSPFKVFKLKSRDVSMETLESGHQKFWAFGNWAGLNRDLIPTIVANLKYSVLEYDYKFCKWRSPEKHEVAERKPCDCENDIHGKLTSTFYLGAKNLYWMSERQQSRYLQKFPFLKDVSQVVLSSVFEEDFWVLLRHLKDKSAGAPRKGWIVLDSPSWIKGRDAAIHWCVTNEVEYEVVKGLSPSEFLEKLSTAEGLVYLPPGGDTCPRMVIEAKLLGCKLQLNENVEHASEDWFTAADPVETESYLYAARETFWNGIRSAMEWKPTISGYTTIYNPREMGYPWQETVKSMLHFCEEVIVLDGGSNDGSWEELLAWSNKDPKIKPHRHLVNFESKRFAYDSDGMQKARARDLCKMEFCWQMDADEAVIPCDYSKIRDLCKRLHPEVDVVCLPVIEYWGSLKKIRVDVNPWKWRLTRNRKYVTHGIPSHLKRVDENGEIYALPGTDGCDYVHRETGEIIGSVNFYSQDAHAVRIQALGGSGEALTSYAVWLDSHVKSLPSVVHYSWLDIEKKIKNYRKYWSKFWQSLYNIEQQDTAENNMFFDKPWSEVTDDEISALAKRLATETGGHVFHEKIDWSKATPCLRTSE